MSVGVADTFGFHDPGLRVWPGTHTFRVRAGRNDSSWPIAHVEVTALRDCS